MKLNVITLAATAAALCLLPSQYNWTSSAQLAEPRDGISLRDFTTAPYKGKTLVYSTKVTEYNNHGSVGFTLFSEWSDMRAANQTTMKALSVSPQLFYFAPKDVWILAYQWSALWFSYRTSNDPSDPNGWSEPKELMSESAEIPPKCMTGPIDPALIGDDEHMYLFWACDNGHIYRASMPIEDFPGSFGTDYDIALQDTQIANVFEAPQVYRLQDQKLYLLTVEAMGRRGRYIRSFTSESPAGPWVSNAATEDKPFAGLANIGPTWTKDISQGELVRVTADQTMTVDACNLELLYTGLIPNPPTFYPYPYRPGVLKIIQ
jgi:hypothetical protein